MKRVDLSLRIKSLARMFVRRNLSVSSENTERGRDGVTVLTLNAARRGRTLSLLVSGFHLEEGEKEGEKRGGKVRFNGILSGGEVDAHLSVVQAVPLQRSQTTCIDRNPSFAPVKTSKERTRRQEDEKTRREEENERIIKELVVEISKAKDVIEIDKHIKFTESPFGETILESDETKARFVDIHRNC